MTQLYNLTLKQLPCWVVRLLNVLLKVASHFTDQTSKLLVTTEQGKPLHNVASGKLHDSILAFYSMV